MGSTNLISQKRGCVITCHFNNVLYCLQALVVPGLSNGGFKWVRERRDGADAGQIDHFLFLYFRISLQYFWVAARAEQPLQKDTKPSRVY